MTNPQNSTFFGEHQPYPLELNDFHRFIIPNYQNDTTETDLFIWCGEYRLVSVCEILGGKLQHVTFKAKQAVSGRLEIKTSSGETLFYSNCVEFIDSTDDDGRKFIRIATKHLYNRNLFDFESQYNWIITSVPAYCLGMTSVEADILNGRIGGNSTLKTKETYIDEVVEYQFLSKGDANILNFLQVHVTNNNFYIDGTQRTCLDKMDRDEFSTRGKLRFTNVKDREGFNIALEYDSILENIFVWVLTDDTKTILYTDNNNNLIQVK